MKLTHGPYGENENGVSQGRLIYRLNENFDLIGLPVSGYSWPAGNAASATYARATGISLHFVVYCGVSLSCRIDHSRGGPAPTALPT